MVTHTSRDLVKSILFLTPWCDTKIIFWQNKTSQNGDWIVKGIIFLFRDATVIFPSFHIGGQTI